MKATFISWAAILVAASALAAEQPWQATLRSESRIAASNIFCIPTFSGMQMHYTVPAPAAKILESRPPEEVLPFLSGLCGGSETASARITRDWALIVREGLRGTPSWVSIMSTTNKLEVFVYSDSRKHAPDPRKP
jgi:hypothetical protein